METGETGGAIAILAFLIICQPVICGAIGYCIGKKKDNALMGTLFGAFLGVFGLLVVALMRDQSAYEPYSLRRKSMRPGGQERLTKECPNCAGRIFVKAKVCRHCNTHL